MRPMGIVSTEGAGRATAGGERREKHNRGRKTGEGNREEERRMAGKMSMGAN